MGKFKKLIYILAGFVIFALFVFISLIPFPASGLLLEEGLVVLEDGATQPISYPHLVPLHENKKVTFQYHFPNTNAGALMIRRPAANAIQVFLNGAEIFRLGDIEMPTGNLWNNIQIVPLVGDLKQDNLLEIVLYGSSYDIGLSIPPYVDVFPRANLKAWLSRLIYHDLIFLSIGAGLITGLLLITVSLLRVHRYRSEFFLSLTCITAAIHCLDYPLRLTSGSIEFFLLSRKIIVICSYLSILFFLMGMEYFTDRRLKFSKVMTGITLTGSLIVMIAWNFSIFNTVLFYLNPVMLVNITATVILLVKNQNRKPWMIIPAVLMTLASAQMVLLSVLNLSYPLITQFTILASVVILGVGLINEYSQVFRENIDLEERANKDPLTGVFNRNVLTRVSPNSRDVLVIMDLDNLKLYNDKYGHAEGDKLLIALMDSVRANSRQTDMIIRFGGDEFIMLLRETSVEAADCIVQRIKEQFSQKRFNEPVTFSYGIARVRGSITETLARADQVLYLMKDRNKNLSRQTIGESAGP
jgi:diguanylate cyclase (GGDEF)-like protein